MKDRRNIKWLLNILMFLFVLISCKPINEITGVAYNSKDGVTIRTNKRVYVDENLFKWNDSLNNKLVVVKCKIIDSAIVTEKDLGYDAKVYKQGRIGKTVRIKILNIKLLE